MASTSSALRSDCPALPAVPFGQQMRESQFLFDKQNINVNHGSFGSFPRPVHDTLRLYQDLLEANPDKFLRYDFPRLLDESRAAVAALVNVDPDNLVLVPNATGGINTVLRNLEYKPGEKIAYFSTIYGACEKTIDHITRTTPAQSIKIDLVYPISDEELLNEFRTVLETYPRIKVAVFDTVSSLPGARMPFEKLAELCREAGVLSLIDGAHGIGHLPLDLGKLDADFFVSNCHKWLYVPRGCAMLYVPKRNQDMIISTFPTSHGYAPVNCAGKAVINNPLPPSTKPRFIEMFDFVGTMDYTPYLCIPAALKFRREVCGGEDVIMKYCQSIALQGARRVAEILGTEVMDNKEKTITKQSCLVNVRLPIEAGFDVTGGRQNLVNAFIGETMVTRHHSFVATVFHGGKWWARMSGQIYLEVGDFDHVGRALLAICNTIKHDPVWRS